MGAQSLDHPSNNHVLAKVSIRQSTLYLMMIANKVSEGRVKKHMNLEAHQW